MSNLKDDDGLEQFFNKGAKRYNINFDERDWQKMEKMLDAENARVLSVRSRRWKAAAISFGLLSLLLMIYFVANKSGALLPSTNGVSTENSATRPAEKDLAKKNDPDESTNTKDQASEEIRSSASRTSVKNDKSAPERAAQHSNAKASLRNNSDPKPEVTSLQSANSEEGLASSETNTVEKNNVNERIKSDGHEHQNRLTSASIVNGSDSASFVKKNDTSLANEPVNGVLTDSLNKLHRAVETQNVPNDSSELNEEPAITKPAEENPVVKQVEDKKTDEEFNYSRWSISLAVAPDFSSTEVFKQSSAGGALGITFQYEFLKRWSLQSGALITSKRYWNTGDEYNNVKPGYWIAKTNGVIPERIDGGCSILEIPLAVRYTVLNIGKSRMQVSAGASSYIMLSEFYTFTFANPNPNATREYQSSDNSNYFFNVGSASISYERMIGPRFGLGIEPYVKIPFANVGWAKLPLYSVGGYVTLRYRMIK